jgi:hypothetical protein
MEIPRSIGRKHRDMQQRKDALKMEVQVCQKGKWQEIIIVVGLVAGMERMDVSPS